jgi:4-amino-4-deoxychorismate lyase/para-aminobenzoate synthetase/4-amino-4-deoxychorismate lyase
LETLVSTIAPAASFDLIETMAFDPEAGMPMLERHLARLSRSADALGFRFDRHALRNELQAATFALTAPACIRLLLGPSGEVAIEVSARRVWPQAIVPVSIVPRGTDADDPRLRHKTTDRALYNAALRAGGTFEVLLLDREGYLSEGCFSTIFVERGDRLVTPPLSRGLLPGVLRQSLIDLGEAEEADLRPRDLEDGFFIGNAARGMVAATLVAPKG